MRIIGSVMDHTAFAGSGLYTSSKRRNRTNLLAYEPETEGRRNDETHAKKISIRRVPRADPRACHSFHCYLRAADKIPTGQTRERQDMSTFGEIAGIEIQPTCSQPWRVARMMFLPVIFFASIGRLPVQASTIAGNLGNTQTFSLGYGPSQILAQQFMTDNQSYILTSVLARVGSFSSNNPSIAELLTDAAGLPSTTVLSSFTYFTIPIGGFANVAFSPVETNVRLTPNTNYWFVLNGAAVGQGALWAGTSSFAHDGPGSILKRADNVGSGWQDISSGFPPFMVQVDGVSIPEPPSWAMCANSAVGILLAYGLWRRSARGSKQASLKSLTFLGMLGVERE
ncbi:MAG TPA: choice-of-anchor R domain-containing protein [Candidatus Acidoferrales bacterium]|nr:choice-of-anchor R domain-containing protein [Candidatus Acidoferrales bacterium]